MIQEETKKKLDQLINDVKPEEPKVIKRKKDGLFEVVRKTKIILTEDNRQLLQD
jgi:hypothetical protein